jgi:2-polyprenyl-3-methyl-5-hydroxy-6-metoxy-1,4-benzoquinol methylase
MSSPIFKSSPPNLLFKIRAELIGLAKDFWKDGGQTESLAKKSSFTRFSKGMLTKVLSGAAKKKRASSGSFEKGRWKADRLAIKEKIWGEGQVLPINDELCDKLIKPFGLNEQMSVLDLSAGLGGLARKMAKDYGSYVTGCEADAEIAAAGMAQSVISGQSKHAEITTYDPETYTPSRHYDCIVLRDLFFRIANKKRFLEAALAGLKTEGQIAITDYVLDKDGKSQDAVKNWLSSEKGTSPVSFDDMANVLAFMRLDVRVNEDLTDMYRHEILRRLGIFAAFLAQHPPDKETKPHVFKELELWAQRAAAMQHGLKFYRFYAIKH